MAGGKQANAFLIALWELPQDVAKDVRRSVAFGAKKIAANTIALKRVFRSYTIPIAVLGLGIATALLIWLGIALGIDSNWLKTNRYAAINIRNLVWAVAAVFGVFIAVIGLILAGRRTKALDMQARTAEQGLITDRIAKANEQLGHRNEIVRIGAIYSLERIAADSDRDMKTIFDMLNAFVRSQSQRPNTGTTGSTGGIDTGAAMETILRLAERDDVDSV